MQYEDFILQIGSDRGDGHPVHVLKSPAGEGSGVLRVPAELKRWLPTVEGTHLRGSEERHLVASEPWQPGLAESTRALGDQLFRALFSGQVRSLYDQSLGTVSSRSGHGLRVKLKFDAKDRDLAVLAGLPWEYLWRDETQDFLSLSRLSPVVRYLDVPRPASAIQLRSKLRILVVISSPRGLASLDLQRERNNLEEACRRSKNVEMQFISDADAQALRRKLLGEPFHVLHFMGHGGFDRDSGEGVLCFTAPDGGQEPVSGHSLSTLLRDFKSLGLVVLNACESARMHAGGSSPFSGVANALVLGGLAAVIAMQFPISDPAAIAFSTTFYQRLALGDSVDAAVVEGRHAVLSAAPQTLEWGTPVLFLRVPDGNVFQLPGQRRENEEERQARARDRSRLAMVLFLAIGWTLHDRMQVAARAEKQALASKYLSFDVRHPFASTDEGLAGVLTRVELAPNGRMRMYFRFRNRSRKDLGLGFDYRASYLADKAGNRYAVLATDTAVHEGETTVDRIAPGHEMERWLEFSAPRDQARNFQVGLVGSQGGAQFPIFSVDLPDYPKGLSIKTPSPTPEPGAAALPIHQSFPTSVPGFQGALQGVELLQNSRMRWSFGFLNQSDRDQVVSFDYSGIYLEDEFGNRYKVLSSDTGGSSGQVYQQTLQRAVRTDHWFEFTAPWNGARSFKIVLISNDRRTLRFIPFAVQIPYYPARYSQPLKISPPVAKAVPKPPPPAPAPRAPVETPAVAVVPPAKPAVEEKADSRRALTLREADDHWATSVKGLSGRLEAIELLPDGRLRWRFEFQNQSGGSQEFGLNLKDSYLSDDLGHRYGIVRSDVGNIGSVFQESIPDGGRVAHWIECSEPAIGARRFIAVLVSHSPKTLRFVPFQAELPEKGPKK
jgi:hypothetical protein